MTITFDRSSATPARAEGHGDGSRRRCDLGNRSRRGAGPHRLGHFDGIFMESLQWERLSAESAGRSAEAAERANRLAERAVEQRVHVFGVPPETTVVSPTSSQGASGVSWRVEKPSNNRYILRNTGTETAEHVEVDSTQAGPITRNFPQDAVIRPGEGADMLIMSSWGHPVPNQLYVRWEGQPEWVAVPHHVSSTGQAGDFPGAGKFSARRRDDLPRATRWPACSMPSTALSRHRCRAVTHHHPLSWPGGPGPRHHPVVGHRPGSVQVLRTDPAVVIRSLIHCCSQVVLE
jgi:hypothetical protein